LSGGIEWHAQARTTQSSGIWHNGRFLEQWADPRILEDLAGAFAHYDEADVRRALFATMDLFRWVARETAERLNTPYPALAENKATQLVSSLLLTSERSGAQDDA
jgi:aminoglycoside 6-adenylyltransferase